jgi:hypothetical protein
VLAAITKITKFRGWLVWPGMMQRPAIVEDHSGPRVLSSDDVGQPLW